jgi:hypothetical protein
MLSKTQDSIMILTTSALIIDQYFDILKKERHDKSSVIYAAVSSQVLLQTCSFKTEWKRFQGETKVNEKVARVIAATLPFIKRINQWIDLELFRNQFIAHNFRDKADVNLFTKDFDLELNIPNQFPDYYLLNSCIQHTHAILSIEFKYEMMEIGNFMKSLKRPTIKAGHTSESDVDDELKELVAKSGLPKYLSI